MSSDQPTNFNLFNCSSCHSTGFLNFRRCPHCHGMAMGRAARGKWLYWGYPLTRYHLNLERGRRVLDHIRWLTALVLSLNVWIWCGWLIYKSHAYRTIYSSLISGHLDQVFSGVGKSAAFLFWLGAASACYIWYRTTRKHEVLGRVEHYEYAYGSKSEVAGAPSVASWEELKKIKKKFRHNIALTFTEEAKAALRAAYKIADKNGAGDVDLPHLFCALLNSNRISNVFIRLGVSGQSLQKNLLEFFKASGVKPAQNKLSMPTVTSDFQTALFDAYEEAYKAHQEYVSVTELVIACVKQSSLVKEMLFDLSINNQKLNNVVEWARIRERLHRQYVKFSRAARHRSKKGMDRAMTALATPYLNQFSEDITMQAQFGYLEPCIARDREIEDLFRIVEGGVQSVILVGDHGVGRRSIVEGVAEKMVADDVPRRLRDKRLVRLSVSALLSGATAAGAVERLRHVMYEISRARNVILFIHDLHELVGVSAGAEGGLDVADTLAEYLGKGRFLTIATTTPADYSASIAGSPVGNVFSKVSVAEMDENQTVQVLESKVGHLEYKQKIFFSYDALEKAAQYSARFIHDSCLPGTALEIMSEAAAFTRDKKGANALVTAEEIAAIISEKTKIPVTTVSSDESAKLLNLEQEMHKRVIGQDEGVCAVANALRRARVEMRSTSRPIANFLFLGPTGVGKTELAKTIANVYFGGEDRMIRLDMSEYQEKSSIDRLIGTPGDKGTGILTEAVRRAPFSLVLLDEIEKADPDVLNLFLQVMDDGRLTDSSGRKIDFTNAIIIATSNAGTSYVQEQLRAGASVEAIKEKLLHGELKQYFKPEFLNRFDGIIVFRPLGQEDIKKIAGLMLKRISKDLEVKGIILKVEDQALDFLSQTGFDPEFGARPMRRALEERVENKLAELLLAGKLRRRDTVVIGEGGKIIVE